MTKTLGLDLVTNSIGWAIIENDNDKILENGISIHPNNSVQTRDNKKLSIKFLQKVTSKTENKYLDKSKLIILSLLTVSVTTGVLSLVNNANWQYWMNLSLTILVALLTLIYSKDK